MKKKNQSSAKTDSVMAQSAKMPQQEKPYVPTTRERMKSFTKQIPEERRIAREQNAISKDYAKQAKKTASPSLKSEAEYYKEQSKGYKQSAKQLRQTAKSIKKGTYGG
jgi:hypothetical protein